MSKTLFSCFAILSILIPQALVNADTRMVVLKDDFQQTNQHNSLSFFGFEIIFAGDIQPGLNENPPIAYLEYHLVGHLPSPTPSDIEVFHLTRIMDGDEFYSQGSGLIFEIASDADLSNGIQFSDLVGSFILNGVELGTGQYHPPLLELHQDGTGTIQNANNFGGINSETGMFVDVDFGQEYIAQLTFDPAEYELTEPFSGDMNRDCRVDLLDIQPFVDAITNAFFDELADMNNDGSDDLLDVFLFVQAVVGN